MGGNDVVASVEPDKSPNDKLAYRHLTFANGFEALLISCDDAKKNKAAAAVAVGAGSFSDPQGRAEGLAHYLEHMLFMGSKKFPGEDQMEEFLSKNGGYSNAFTEAGHTCYYFEVNKQELQTATDMLAQFFVAPLLKTDAAEREIHAIDSEFKLTQNSDGSRVEQLFASFAKDGHPYRTFGWGNLKSLQEATKKAGVDLNGELRAFFDKYYRAPRLRLCLYGMESLDVLEKWARGSFEGMPDAAPGESARGPQEDALAEVGQPYTSLPKMLRVRPVKDTHTLTVAWQLPPMQHLYKSKPASYLEHCVGHEGAGSLLSWLKKQGWATRLSAGVSDDSFINNSMSAIFDIDITLTVDGLRVWRDVGHACMLYLNMLRKEGPQEWIYKEMVADMETGWKFLQEKHPSDQVEELSCAMLPVFKLDRKDVLKSRWMLPEWVPDAITDIMKDMTPDKMMVNVLSAAYGRAKVVAEPEEGEEDAKGEGSEGGEEEDDEEGEEEEGGDGDSCEEDPDGKKAEDPSFDVGAAGAPAVEPHFGTEYWEASGKELEELVARWKTEPAAGSILASAVGELRLPDRNIFLASDFALRPKPAEAGVREATTVTTEGLRRLYASFPPLPDTLPQRPRQLEAAAAAGWRAWHLQDTVFETPRSELWLKLATDGAPIKPQDARTSTLLSFLAVVLKDVMNETAYLAERASLHISAWNQTYGLSMCVGGFSHKLPLLLEAGLKQFLAFGEASYWQQRVTDATFRARVAAQRESLLRAYRNAYLKPANHCEDMRRLLVIPHRHAATEKAEALEALHLEDLAAFAQELIPKLRAEVLFSGNATVEDADALVQALPASLREAPAGQALEPLPRHPELPIAVVPNSVPSLWVEDCPDRGNHNAAVEMYFQFECSHDHRPKVVCDVLEALMTEPLFDTLRTKQQLGYVASCCGRFSQGVNGFSIWLLSSKVGAAEICERVEAFLVDFRKKVAEEIPDEDIEKHIVALGAHKLEPDRTLASVQETAWSELQERRRVFDRHVQEAAELATVTRADVLRLIDERLARGATERRLLVVASLGGKAKAEKSAELEALRKEYPGARTVSSRSDFLAGTTLFPNMA